MSEGGKGSRPRPFSVSQEEYNNRWDAIFGRDLPTEEYRINKSGQPERFREGQWELDSSSNEK